MCAARLNAEYLMSKMPQTDWDKERVAFLSNDSFILGRRCDCAEKGSGGAKG